jgi:hypothetical protein
VALAVFNVSGNVALTVLGAIVVSGLTAVITAHTTNGRLDKQLKAERERMDSQLTAEEVRQNAQLQHDRELSDLAELRSLLDDTSRLLSRVVKTSAQVAANWKRRAESEGTKERLANRRQALRNELVQIAEQQQRIMLRLPKTSDPVTALHKVREHVTRLHDLSGAASFMNHDEAEDMQHGKPAMDVADAHIVFLNASRELVQAKLPD